MFIGRPNPLDAIVGFNIRLHRSNLGLSQIEFGERIGVSFERIQKFEQGMGRIGASHLYRIAAVLDISVAELFQMPGSVGANSSNPLQLLSAPGALQILEAYARTANPRVRQSILKLIEAVAERQSRASIAPKRKRQNIVKLGKEAWLRKPSGSSQTVY